MPDDDNNQQDLIECILETIREPFLVLDRHYNVIKASKNFCHSFGLNKPDVENQLLFNVGEGEWDIAKLKRLLDEVMTKGTTIEAFLVEHRFSDIGDKVFLLNARTVIAQEESDLKILLAFEDITERKKKDDEILRLAMTDPLTGLSNRNSFTSGLERAIKFARRYGHGISLLIIDLDKFKAVNDHHGHPVGDQLLKQVAAILTSRIREVDQVARLGGDEFAVILGGVTKKEMVNEIAQNYINKIMEPFHIEKSEILIGASIGLAHFPENANNATNLIKCADVALYSAKKDGGNIFRVYQGYLG
ncbi:sensor domain-containing diguanylate cyclase [Terasakiella sp. A23]|uniref:sensor domain-containing diguanylate cyclase n=1 Tax=Terasakiella sp. FCG-A23 TaxID=3080561 RepID=UPI0029553240|nr:sensor domain-containing diguanylate cyclase [Terasakiella sp. A23]MDV7338904.1 sensor domain-containing diguanylate cyclase [Terasakiella sp. A23]